MCKRIIFSLLICSLLASCTKVEKGEEPIAQKELIPISFNVGFSKEVTDFRSTAKSGDPIPFGYSNRYLVYNKETGKLYKDKSFELGVFDDELPEGEYIFLFIVATDNVTINTYRDGSNNIDRLWVRTLLERVYDVFHCRVDCEVKKGENNNQQVVLERMVGKVKVILEDDVVPDNIAKIEVWIDMPNNFRYYPDADNYSVYSATPNFSFGDKWLEIHSPQYPIDEFSATSFECRNYQTAGGEHLPLTIDIFAWRERTPAEIGVMDPDSGGLIVVRETIENVFIERNKTVIYRGKLFDNIIIPPGPELPSSSFSISINEEWGEDINETF